jgi:hypothetical protein
LSTGQKYVGEFIDGFPNGKGEMTLTDGTRYVGEFKVTKFHGQGTLTFLNGRKWVGKFKENIPWNIIIFDKDNNTIGNWVNGIEIGVNKNVSGVVEKREVGTLWGKEDEYGVEKWYRTGGEMNEFSRYEGEILNGEPNGLGTLTSIYNIEIREGEFKDGEMDGQGSLTFPHNGEKWIGEWSENYPLNYTEYDYKGNIIQRYVKRIEQE